MWTRRTVKIIEKTADEFIFICLFIMRFNRQKILNLILIFSVFQLTSNEQRSIEMKSTNRTCESNCFKGLYLVLLFYSCFVKFFVELLRPAALLIKSNNWSTITKWLSFRKVIVKKFLVEKEQSFEHLMLFKVRIVLKQRKFLKNTN